MKKTLLIASFVLSTAAYGADINFGLKLYKDGMYKLADQTFSQILTEENPEKLKPHLTPIAETFIKTGNVKKLKTLVNLWEKTYPEYKKGYLLALKTFLRIKEGESPEKSIDEKTFPSLTLNEKIDFFEVLKKSSLPIESKFYFLTLGEKSVEVKGALRDSGFLEKIAEEAVEAKRKDITDYVFKNFGEWIKDKKFEMAYTDYLIQEKHYLAALKKLNKIYKTNKNPEVLNKMAKVYYLQGEYGKALKLAQKLKTEEGKFLRAWCYYKLNLKKKAFNELGMSIEKPTLPKSLEAIIDFLKGKGKPEELKKFYPELYFKSLLYTFSHDADENIDIKKINLHDTGFFYYESGHFDKAFNIFKNAVSSQRDKYLTPRTLFLLGEIAGINKDLNLMVYSQIANNYRTTPYYGNSLLPYSKSLMLKGSFEAAINLLNYGREQFKLSSVEAKKLLGQSYFYNGDYEKAVKVLKPAALKNDEAFHFLITALVLSGNNQTAFEYLRTRISDKLLFSDINYGRTCYLAVKLNKEKLLSKIKPPKEPTAAAVYATITGKTSVIKKFLGKTNGGIREGLLYLLATKEKTPDKKLYYIMLLKTTASNPETLKFAKKLEEYTAYKIGKLDTLLLNNPQFIIHNPENEITDINSIIAKANDYYEANGILKAYGLYKLALENVKDPELKAETAAKMVEIDLKLKNYNKALRDVALIPETDTKNKDIKSYLLMEIYYKQGKLIDALNAGQNISDIENLPKENQVKYAAKMAYLYKLANNESKAMELLSFIAKSGHISSIDYDDLVNLAIFLDKKGESEKALNLLKEAYKKAKKKEQKAESLFWIASLEEKLGKSDKAVMNYLKIHYEIGKDPWASTAIYRAALLLEKKGNYRESLKLLRKVVKIKGNTPEGKKASEKIKEIEKRLKGGS